MSSQAQGVRGCSRAQSALMGIWPFRRPSRWRTSWRLSRGPRCSWLRSSNRWYPRHCAQHFHGRPFGFAVGHAAGRSRLPVSNLAAWMATCCWTALKCGPPDFAVGPVDSLRPVGTAVSTTTQTGDPGHGSTLSSGGRRSGFGSLIIHRSIAEGAADGTGNGVHTRHRRSRN